MTTPGTGYTVAVMKIMVLVFLVLVGCVDAEGDGTAWLGSQTPDEQILTHNVSTSTAAAPVSKYPNPGAHRLDTYCPADPGLDHSIYFDVDEEGGFQSELMTAGRAFRAYPDGTKWRLFVQQAGLDHQGCVTLFEYTALVSSSNTVVYAGTFRRQCPAGQTTLLDCFASYQ